MTSDQYQVSTISKLEQRVQLRQTQKSENYHKKNSKAMNEKITLTKK